MRFGTNISAPPRPAKSSTGNRSSVWTKVWAAPSNGIKVFSRTGMNDRPTLTCRACGGDGLRPVLDLGRTPLANALLTAEQLSHPEPVYPLELFFCPACTLIQISETVPPEQLFREYVYLSSFSTTMLRHAETLSRE